MWTISISCALDWQVFQTFSNFFFIASEAVCNRSFFFFFCSLVQLNRCILYNVHSVNMMTFSALRLSLLFPCDLLLGMLRCCEDFKQTLIITNLLPLGKVSFLSVCQRVIHAFRSSAVHCSVEQWTVLVHRELMSVNQRYSWSHSVCSPLMHSENT